VSYGAALGVQFVLSFAVIIVPTLLIGATFPVMIAAVGRGVDRLGRDVGLVYGANTLGTIVGSVAAGFFLIPWIGIQNTVRLAAARTSSPASRCSSSRTRRGAFASAGALAAFTVLVVVVPHWTRG
jgi:predicted membrane-bound spermidine synthase